MDIAYEKICFVIMPFGIKTVGQKEVDFDRIYNTVFAPAIETVILPEGDQLVPKRADSDIFSAVIDVEMFNYIEYSRFTIADISGLNPNVFYELGVRHTIHQSGTAVFHQAQAPIPFNTSRIRAFPYEYEPEEHIADSRRLIAEVLADSLRYNRIDSPVRLALAAQKRLPHHVEQLLAEAENAIRNQDRVTAIGRYLEALRSGGASAILHLRLGVLLKDRNDWGGAVLQFNEAVKLSPNYADAWREKGIAENKLYCQEGKSADLSTGEAALAKAISLNSDDYDAHASLGGVLKRLGNYEGALNSYRRATELSSGNTYPLLNEIELQTYLQGMVKLEPKQLFMLTKAQRSLHIQVANTPPYNAPWSFFDLSETYLYQGDQQNFLRYLEEGIGHATAVWQIETHRHSLELLSTNTSVPGVEKAVTRLKEVEAYF